jgi:hypothetical protein
MSDHYADGTYGWWHLSVPSPELVQAVADRWLSGPGAGWHIEHMERTEIPSDTRTLDVLLVRLVKR